MISRMFSVSRRGFLGAAAVAAVRPPPAQTAERKTVSLELSPAGLDLGPEQQIQGSKLAAAVPQRLVRGDVFEVTVRNKLTVAAAIHWRGLDGAPELQPWLARPPIPAGETGVFTVPLRHAGTLVCEARAIDGVRLAALPLAVAEIPSMATEADETLLIEAWPGGSDASTYSVNQRRMPLQIKAAPNARLRLRFANATQHSLFAIQLPGLTPIVVAIDGQPCEPFPARDARVILAPSTRIDVMVDTLGAAGTEFAIVLADGKQTVTVATLTLSGDAVRAAPLPISALPSNGLPERLALASALRIDLRLDDVAGWSASAGMSASNAPVFTAKRGRTVVLALSNTSDRAMLFHLNGHHARLLDRLDDGWKPFWLDTLAVPPRQTLRLAFVAEHAGNYLLETSALEAGALPRLRSYRVVA